MSADAVRALLRERAAAPGPIDRLIERHLHRLNPALVGLYRALDQSSTK